MIYKYTKKEWKETEDYLVNATELYKNILGLKHLNFSFVFDDEIEGTGYDDKYTLLTINPNTPYLNATINWGCMAIKYHKAKQLERHLVHELIHCITRPLYDLAGNRIITIENLNETDERIVDHLANIIYRLVDRARANETR